MYERKAFERNIYVIKECDVFLTDGIGFGFFFPEPLAGVIFFTFVLLAVIKNLKAENDNSDEYT